MKVRDWPITPYMASANKGVSPPPPDARDVQNFGWLESWLGRGGEPNPTGFRWLVEHGVVTIVNLRAEDNTEAVLGRHFKIKHLQIPVADNRAPTDAQAMQFLGLCATAERRPLYFHCQSGHGRTSTFCILFRLAQGMKLTDAIREETRRYGFLPIHDPSQIDYLQNFRRRIKTGQLVLPAME